MTGPVVRMCEDPEGHDWKACPHTVVSRRTMGLTEVLGPDVVALGQQRVLDIIRQELAISPASDSHGVQHIVPPRCEFIVHIHRGTDNIQHGVRAVGEPGYVDLSVAPRVGDSYIAVLSAPDVDLDDLLADSPQWTSERVSQRLAALRAAA